MARNIRVGLKSFYSSYSSTGCRNTPVRYRCMPRTMRNRLHHAGLASGLADSLCAAPASAGDTCQSRLALTAAPAALLVPLLAQLPRCRHPLRVQLALPALRNGCFALCQRRFSFGRQFASRLRLCLPRCRTCFAAPRQADGLTVTRRLLTQTRRLADKAMLAA